MSSGVQLPVPQRVLGWPRRVHAVPTELAHATEYPNDHRRHVRMRPLRPLPEWLLCRPISIR